MEILPLGVGSAFAKTLENTNFLIRPARGEPFLLDCGHTATRALNRLGLPHTNGYRILLSHLHADHIGGLEEMGFSGQFLWNRKIDLFLPASLLEWLWPHCLEGGMGQRLPGPEESFFEAELSTYFNVHALEVGETLEMGSVLVRPVPTPHVPGRPSYGFHMTERETGHAVFFTCDSKFSQRNLDQYGQEAKLIFHDCQFNGGAGAIHTRLSELVGLPEEMRNRILLCHYGDDWRNYEGALAGMQLAHAGKSYKV